MGNISSLSRVYNNTLIDSLTYGYTNSGNYTNQVQSVADLSGNNAGLVAGTMAYGSYDPNGNTLNNTNSTNTTQNKSFTYNLLNLPQTAITATGGTDTYTYDATGNKLRKVNVNGSTTVTTDYISGIQYNNSTTTIGFIQTEEGKAVLQTNGSYDYTYYLGDNLGNTRITFDTQTSVAAVQQQDDYYPFGMEILRTSPIPNPKNEYLYNKKELQEELQQYDYGARFYDPVVVHWNTIDPLAEMSRRWSPYNYVENNPIRLIDPDGMSSSLSDAEVSEVQQEEAANASAALALSGRSGGNQSGSLDDQEPGLTQQTSKADTAKAKGTSLSSKMETGTNIVAGITMVGLLGPEDPLADVASGLEELVGQIATGVVKLGELVGDLWTTLNFAQGKGERKQAGSASGTNSPYKKLKPDPKKPGNVLEKNGQTGKTISKPEPRGFKEWWNANHPNNKI